MTWLVDQVAQLMQLANGRRQFDLVELDCGAFIIDDLARLMPHLLFLDGLAALLDENAKTKRGCFSWRAVPCICTVTADAVDTHGSEMQLLGQRTASLSVEAVLVAPSTATTRDGAIDCS